MFVEFALLLHRKTHLFLSCMLSEMLIKLKSLAKLAGKERLVLIPLSESGRFVLGLNFFEDVEGGREARFVIAEDRYGELNDVKVIEGDKVLVRAEGVREDVDKSRDP